MVDMERFRTARSVGASANIAVLCEGDRFVPTATMAPTVGIQIADRFILEFAIDGGALIGFDTWASISTAEAAVAEYEPPEQDTEVLRLLCTDLNDVGTIYDLGAGSDYVDATQRVWWCGDLRGEAVRVGEGLVVTVRDGVPAGALIELEQAIPAGH